MSNLSSLSSVNGTLGFLGCSHTNAATNNPVRSPLFQPSTLANRTPKPKSNDLKIMG